MYIPKQFREERLEVLASAIREIQLAALVTPIKADSQISHVPVVLKESDSKWTLETHVSRANPHWSIVGASSSVAIFQGPHAYISPSWYETKRQHGKVLPTWNYVAIHVHGMLEAVEDKEWILAHLNDLTRRNENDKEHPWEVSDAPREFIDQLAGAIVGLRLRVDRIEGAWKMIQHRSDGDRLGTISGLERQERISTVASVMRELEIKRSSAP